MTRLLNVAWQTLCAVVEYLVPETWAILGNSFGWYGTTLISLLLAVSFGMSA